MVRSSGVGRIGFPRQHFRVSKDCQGRLVDTPYQVTHERKWDVIMGATVGNLLTGISMGWWKATYINLCSYTQIWRFRTRIVNSVS